MSRAAVNCSVEREIEEVGGVITQHAKVHPTMAALATRARWNETEREDSLEPQNVELSHQKQS